MRLPVVLGTLDYFGNLVWSPSASVSVNADLDGIDHPDLKGPSYNWGHSVSLAIDWFRNFRKGFSFDIGNSWSWNAYNKQPIALHRCYSKGLLQRIR